MFENIENNKQMIMGAYKKLKSYYYYDKTILYNKVRIALWESNEEIMNNNVFALAKFLESLENTVDIDYLNSLLKNIALVPTPKSFSENDNNDNSIISNINDDNPKLEKVNFFIKLPVELLVLDTLWALMIGKIAYDNNRISPNAYANRIKKYELYKDETKDLFDGIDYRSNRLFVPYFKQYKSWRNNAFEVIENRYVQHSDSILISLDIKSYYYSVVFNFNNLGNQFENDVRIEDLKPLTSIIEKVYIMYTLEMKKYRGKSIYANVDNNECALPIGLISSSLLANIYLFELDKKINENLTPMYYGRYVDDILIVLENKTISPVTIDNILDDYLVSRDIICSEGQNEYSIKLNNNKRNLRLQKNKIRCILFDHNEPDALIKLLCEQSKTKGSIEEGALMPDFDFSEKEFFKEAYSLGELEGALKVRELMFSTNNFNAILFINNLIRLSKNINVNDSAHQEYIDKQLRQIFNFYRGIQSIKYKVAWVHIFSLMLINNRFDCLLDFYFHIKKSIRSIDANDIESIADEKTRVILESVREALYEQLDLVFSISLAPMPLNKVKNYLIEIVLKNNEYYEINLDDIFKNALDIRKANMFNHHLLTFPLVNYILDEKEGSISLIDLTPEDVYKYSRNDGKLTMSKRKIDLSPRFIHYDELVLLNFLTRLNKNNNDAYISKMDFFNNEYAKINSILNKLDCLKYSKEEISDELVIHKISYTEKRNTFSTIKVAIASANIDEDDVKKVIINGKFQLSQKKKQNLYMLLNNALKNEAKIVVLPEFFLPIEWISEVISFSRKNGIAIVSGLRYITHNNTVNNFMIVIQPFKINKYRHAAPIIREKNYYAPLEKQMIASTGYDFQEPINKEIIITKWNNFNYGELMCYELTDIEYRYVLRNKVELLIIPELNKDTEYFSNIVETTSRDLHCFVVQVNTSKYGDSRITAPYNSFYKDIVKIKGGEDDTILTGNLNLEELFDNRQNYVIELKKNIAEAKKTKKVKNQTTKRKVKDPSAGF